MAGRAFPGSLGVDHGGPAGDLLFLPVAIETGNFDVSAGQGEPGAFFVIELHWFPGDFAVAGRTIRRRTGSPELPAVNILVTTRTLFRSALENNMPDRGAHVRRFVAFGATDGAMCAVQGKSGAGVVESPAILPTARRVTTLAGEVGFGGSASGCDGDPGKLPAMRVGMTRGTTGRILEDKAGGGSWMDAGRRFVAFLAGGGYVCAGQLKAGLLVLRKCEGRGVEPGLVVTVLAAVLVRRPFELPSVCILVAVEAFGVGHAVQRPAAGNRDVALGTCHPGMFAGQRIRALLVPGQVEGRRFEAGVGMAGGAILGFELAVVRIFAMAVRASFVGDGFLEVGVPMAFEALVVQFRMLAQEGETGLRVIE